MFVYNVSPSKILLILIIFNHKCMFYDAELAQLVIN